MELSERDCGDRNRPAEVDLTGSGETSLEEKRGSIRLSKQRTRAAAEAQQKSQGEEPNKEQMKEEHDDGRGQCGCACSQWLYWGRPWEGGSIWSFHSALQPTRTMLKQSPLIAY